MQAGLAKRRLSFRDVFTFLFAILWCDIWNQNLKVARDSRAKSYKLTVVDGNTACSGLAV